MLCNVIPPNTIAAKHEETNKALVLKEILQPLIQVDKPVTVPEDD